VRGHERPDSLEALAVEADGQLAVALLLDELVGAVIPDLDRSGAVLAGRDLAGEGGVLERVVLDVHGEGAAARLKRHPLGHRPRGEGTVPLEPEVVVEPPGVVALDDEDRAAGASPAPERLGRLAGISLALEGVELRHLFHRYAGRV